MRILDDLIQEVFPPTLKFIGTDCCTALLTETGSHNVALNAVVSGVMEVNAFLKIFSALLDKVVLREEMEKKARMDESDGKMREDPSLLFRSVRLSACLSLSLSLCVSLSFLLSLSVCLSLSVSVCPYICLFLFLFCLYSTNQRMCLCPREDDSLTFISVFLWLCCIPLLCLLCCCNCLFVYSCLFCFSCKESEEKKEVGGLSLIHI